MADLLHDVDDMMRQERLMNIWRAYGNYIIAGVLLLIIAVGLNQAYGSWYRHTSERDTAALIAAGQDKDPSAALTTLADEAGGDTPTIARLLAAQDQIKAGAKDKAIELLLAARNDARANKDLRDLATLLWVRLVSADASQKPDDLRAALTPLMRDDGQPYAWAARIEAAAIAANRQNDAQGAIDLLLPLTNNPAIPYTQADRAKSLIQVYRAQMPVEKFIKDANKEPAQK